MRLDGLSLRCDIASDAIISGIVSRSTQRVRGGRKLLRNGTISAFTTIRISSAGIRRIARTLLAFTTEIESEN